MYRSRRWGVLALALLSTEAAAISYGSPSDETSVVWVVAPNTTCSGVLLTPRWVLTANHCVTNSDGFQGGTGADLFIVIPEGGGPADETPPDRVFTHTFAESGNILVQTTGHIDSVTTGDVGIDLALIKLDQRVPSTVAVPMHPPLFGAPTCDHDDDFEGRIVGFGDTELASPSDEPARRWQSSSDYYWVDDDPPFYENTWDVPPFASDSWYHGILGGDSGGPLIEVSTNTLCGVASRYAPDIECVFIFGCIPIMEAQFAPIENALGWIEAAIVRDGWYEGECKVFNSDDDEDGDMIPDGCDNCPEHDNEDQIDTDGDTVGDACDVCGDEIDDVADNDCDGCANLGDPCPYEGNVDLGPFVAGDTSCGDFDYDGRCNHLDVCWAAFDPIPHNSNEVAEEQHIPMAIWPDACDPVPSPRTRPGKGEIEVLMDNNDLYTAKITTDTIKITPQPTRSEPNAIVSWGSTIELPVENVTTSFRFCQPTAFVDCMAPTSLHDSQLWPNYTATTEPSWVAWHRVTMTSVSSTPGATRIYDYDGDGPYTETWDYVADAERWIDNQVPVPPPEPWGGPASGLGGWFWVHADTPVGSTQDLIGGGMGLHVDGGGWASTEIANAFIPFDPERIHNEVHIVLNPIWFLLVLTLPDPEHGLDTVSFPGDRFLVGLDESGQAGVLADSGKGHLLQSAASGAAAALADTSLRWVGASETDLAPEADEALAVALSSDGSAVVDWLSSTDGRLLSATDRGENVIGRGGIARSGYAATWSRFLGSAFVVGGDRDGTIARFHLASQSWDVLPTDLAVGTPRAAVVSFVDRQLYVLDEVPSGRTTSRRLLRVDPQTGRVTALSSWTVTGVYDRFWLALDHDGNVLVEGSHSRDDRHRVVRVRPGATVGTCATAGDGELQWPVFATAHGYAAVLEGRDQPGLQRWDTVEQVACSGGLETLQ